MHTITGLVRAVLSVGVWWFATVVGVVIVVLALYGLLALPLRVVNDYRFRHGHL
jgi:hypothetical protein